MTEDYKLDAEQDEMETLNLITTYQKILRGKIDKREIVDFIRDLVNEHEIISFSTQNSALHINVNRPIFKLKIKYDDMGEKKSGNIVEDKTNYLFDEIIVRTTDFISEQISGIDDIQDVIEKLKLKFPNKKIFNIVTKSVFSVLINKKNDKCYLEYLVS